MKLNGSQERAVRERDKSLIVTAGAGSGKTRVLVERYVGSITDMTGDSMRGPESVIAITFTEKAAAEMRSRVEKALREKIAAETRKTNKLQLRGILERLPSARISTIDSFCLNLVRRHPMEAGVHPEFAVLEPATADALRSNAVIRALEAELAKIGRDEKRELTEFIAHRLGGLASFLAKMHEKVKDAYWMNAKGFTGKLPGIDGNLTSIREEAIRIFERDAAARKALDFSMIEDRAIRVLRSSAGDEIRAGVDQILVDEYQDVNKVQDELIQLLAMKPGSPKKQILSRGKLFIVGDPKQSVYRFRGAEPRIFEKWIEAAQKEGRHVHLEHNYRTNPILVEFGNRLFGGIMKENFSPSKAGRPEFHANGEELVRIIACPKDESDLIYMRTAIEILKIKGSVKGGRGEGSPRDISFKDIALLTPSNDGMDPYVDALRRLGIPAVVMKSGAFYQSGSVSFVANLLGVAIKSTDNVAAYQLLASPSYAIREATIASVHSLRVQLCLLFDEKVPEGVRAFFDEGEWNRFERARNSVLAVRRLRNSMGTAEILQRVADELGFEEDVLRGYGRRGAANFRKMVEIASNPALGLGNPIDFLEHILYSRDNNVMADEPDIMDDDEDAIRVMTIHKSKGLEFPVVIIGDGNYDFERVNEHRKVGIITAEDGALIAETGDEDEDSAFQEALEDYCEQYMLEKQRLIYVASTRAEELLVISGCERSGKAASDRPERKGRYLFGKLQKLEDETCEGSPCSRLQWIDDMQESEAAKVAASSLVETAFTSGTPSPLLWRGNDRIVRFSPSSIMLYLSCPKEFLRKQWYRLPEKERNKVGKNTSAKADYRASDLGTIVHFIAENMEELSEKEDAVEKAKATFGPMLCDNDALMKKVLSLTDNYGRFIAESPVKREVLKEVGFSVDIDGFTLEGMIDRIEEDGRGGWIITDLKTNNLERTDIEKLKDKYEIQLKSYAYAAGKALGTTAVSARLLFLMSGEMVEIDDVDFEGTRKTLLDIMCKASVLPENCRSLTLVCGHCGMKSECDAAIPLIEDEQEPENEESGLDSADDQDSL